MSTETDIDDTPKDLDEMRVRMARRIADFEQHWQSCPARPCQRARRCIDAALVCVPDRPLLSDNGDDRAQVTAELRAALSARLALLGCAE